MILILSCVRRLEKWTYHEIKCLAHSDGILKGIDRKSTQKPTLKW